MWNSFKPRVAHHFAGASEALEKILATPRLCTMLWMGRPYKKLEGFAVRYDVRVEGAHDARGDSKALAEALAEALTDISRTQRQITAALAGPKATMRLVMALPVIGIIGGELGGQSSLGFLLGTGLGASVFALGAAMMLGAWWWLRLLAERAKPDPGAIGLEMDLFAIATGGGALPERAHDLVSSVCSEYLVERGEADALSHLVALSRRAGVPVAGRARASARLRRDLGRPNAEDRMARLGVSVVMPLGLLVLPAFVLVAVVPLAVSLWEGSLV